MGFYGFLQMLMLFIAGFYVSYNFLEERISSLIKVKDIVMKTRMYVGLASMFFGVWSFFSPYFAVKASVDIQFGQFSFLGDLIPAVLLTASGLILASLALTFVNLSGDLSKSDERKQKIQSTLDNYSTVIGISTIIAGFLHIIDLIGGGYPFI
ncbi:MAG: TMEM43 family protein [Spirochaetota bacterium]|nr:TMEM43 family protein [Spirochaetota bacterium]